MISYRDRLAVRPLVGTAWAWEPYKPHVAAIIKVTAIHWDGQEWRVSAQIVASVRGTETVEPEWRVDLSRFWEASYALGAAGPWGASPSSVRRGEPQPDEEGGQL